MKILLADDHSLFRAGISHVLGRLSDHVEIVEADDHASTLKALASHSDITLLLLDLAMPGMHGLRLLDVLTTSYPAIPIVILSASEDRVEMQQALDAGALGFIPKSATPAIMLSAIKLVLAGGIYIPSALMQNEPMPEPLLPKQGDLTPRQSDVLARVLEGKSNKAIAAELGLTEATVKAHVTAIFRALRVSNRMQAALAVGKVTFENS